MSKLKTAFFCSSCGNESAKWLGKCPACGEWNTFTQEVIQKASSNATHLPWEDATDSKKKRKAVVLDSLEAESLPRLQTEDAELNRVLGGGIVPGSVVLVAGEPGIGKSTLFLQNALALKQETILYISGEESPQQVKMRADRLGIRNPNFYLLAETNIQIIFAEVKRLQPTLIIVDSVQTLASSLIDSPAGSISQIKECAGEWQRYAKETNVPVFLIGHITKDGSVAGPKLLEHMVDTVLQFEGDRHHTYRILRTLKNRFGSTSELGIYQMTSTGMRPVVNPSELFITQKDELLSGSAIAATMEGMRPMLIEIQALVTPSIYGTPQRTVSGIDLRRLQLLLAVLEKRGGFQFGLKDVFLNLAGGLRVEDPSIDLAVVVALLSSYEDVPVSIKTCFAGEVGLNGEVRAVHRIEQRITEAAKLGFEKILVSKYNVQTLKNNSDLEIVPVGTMEEVYKLIF